MRATRAIGRLRHVAVLPVALLALVAVACGDDDDDTSTANQSESGHEDMTVEITSPTDGEGVGGSFDVQFASSVELGATDTGRHHVHLYPDADGDDYEVVESDSFTVEDLEEGEHTLRAVLANADHSETDAEDEVTVTVASGGGGGGDDGGDDDGGGGYDYSP
jgi:hypothetical protein